MSVLTLSFLVSLFSSFWLVRYSHLHVRHSGDYDISGIQKFHTTPVPRIGGVSILMGLIAALSLRYSQNEPIGILGLLMIVSALPLFGAGLLEDFTKHVGVKYRLLAAVFSALCAGFLVNAWLSSLQVLGVDDLMLTYPFIAIFITCFGVAGVSNAFNIIDGYNGLSAVTAVIILSGIAYVAFKVTDHAIMIAAFAMIGALLGFLVWNYPRGLIFLGDGGAYLVGFWIAELSVLLTARHPEVSKWFPLLLCGYPIFETVFSIYRRILFKRVHPGLPDASHLHQLIYKRIVRWTVGGELEMLNVQRNALTSPYLWIVSLMAVIPAVIFWRNDPLLKLFSIFFMIFYIWLYMAIVRFKVPKCLIIKKNFPR